MTYRAITDLKIKIEQLRTGIDAIEMIDNLVINLSRSNVPFQEQAKTILVTKNIRKTYNYNANIISLYGYLERFIENLIKEYFSLLCKLISSFSKQPEIIRKKHTCYCIDLLSKLSYAKYAHISEKQIINSIYQTIHNNKSELIPEAFLQNKGNYKRDIICHCFSDLGFTNIEDNIKKYPPLNEYFIKRFGNNYSNQNNEILFNLLDDLIRRRNDIAHGSDNTQIIDNDIFLDYIQFVDDYTTALNELVQNKLYEIWYESTPEQEIVPNDIFKKNILCANFENFHISNNDFLICKKGQGNHPQYVKTRIINIQVNGNNKQEVTSCDKLELGLTLSSEINKKCKFKIWKDHNTNLSS